MKKARSSILLVILLFAGCVSKNTNRTVFWHAMGGPLGEALLNIVNNYNAQVPDSLKIVQVNLGNYSTLSQKIMGAVASSRPPTFSQVYESWTSELMDAGKIVPVEEYKDMIPDSLLEDIFPPLIKDNTWNGKLVTFPFNKSVPVYYYNKDLFREYGIDSFPRTWQEFREVAKKLTIDKDGDGKPDIYGTAFVIDVWMFATLLYQKGGRLIVNDSAVFDSKAGVEALQFLYDLVYKDSCAYITTGYKHQDDFAAGKVAMVWGTIVSYSFMKDKIDFDLGVARIPMDAVTKDSTVIVSGTNVTLYRDVPDWQRRNAIEFIKYFLRPENQAYWSVHTGYLPLTKSAFEQPEMKKFFEEVPGMEEAMKQVAYCDFEPNNPAWFTGRRYLSTEGLEYALRGVLPVDKALKRAAKIINLELKRKRKH